MIRYGPNGSASGSQLVSMRPCDTATENMGTNTPRARLTAGSVTIDANGMGLSTATPHDTRKLQS